MSVPDTPSPLSKHLAASRKNRDRSGVNWLLIGDPATGKTHTLYTARQPIYCHSFDPGGSSLRHVRKMTEEGTAIVNREPEQEDPENPTAFTAFENSFIELYKSGAFNHIGTYAIDSLTFLCEAMMNNILKKAGRAATKPQFDDYAMLKRQLLKVTNICCNLPCDFILTAHVTTDIDEVSRRRIASLIVTGKNSQLIQRSFDEVYFTDVLKKDDKTLWRVRTISDGTFGARTRIGSGVFQEYETPDLMYLRKKAGVGLEHLPPIT